MKRFFAIAFVGLGFLLTSVACHGGGGGNGSGGGQGDGQSGSNQTCHSSHICSGGSCNCGPNGKGPSCSDDSSCEQECQVCS